MQEVLMKVVPAVLRYVAAPIVTYLLGRVHQATIGRRNWRERRRQTVEQIGRAVTALSEFWQEIETARQGEVTKAPDFAVKAVEAHQRYLDRDPRLEVLPELVKGCPDRDRQKRLLDAREGLRAAMSRCNDAVSLPSGDQDWRQAVLDAYSGGHTAVHALREGLREYAQTLEPPKRNRRPPRSPANPGRLVRLRRFLRFLPRWYKYVTDRPNVSPAPPHPDPWDGSRW